MKSVQHADPHYPAFLVDETGNHSATKDQWADEEIKRLISNGFVVRMSPLGGFVAQRRYRIILSNSIRDKLTRKLLNTTSGTCYYCLQQVRRQIGTKQNNDTATIDHYTPLSRRGSWKKTNLVPCCFSCNKMKGNLTGGEFLYFIAAFPSKKDGRHIRSRQNAIKNYTKALEQAGRIKDSRSFPPPKKNNVQNNT